MRRRLIAVLLCIVIAGASVAVFILSRTPPHPEAGAIKVGVFCYVWYGALNSDWSEPKKFVDYPVYPLLGNYSSLNSTVIQNQLILMKDAGIDFVVLSWWGFYDSYGNFTDNAAKQVFQTAEEMANSTGEWSLGKLKFAIMVEPFNKTGNSYDYSAIYNHVNDDFLAPYSSIYYTYHNEPLICIYDNGSLNVSKIPMDDRFDVILVGSSDHAQWVYNNIDSDKSNWAPHTTEISVTPRFNNSIDVDLSQDMYGQQWENALALLKAGKIDTVMITSWNEYVERTEIEPHHDKTAYNPDPYFLYNKTKDYINQIQ
jgi:hypothetical protein